MEKRIEYTVVESFSEAVARGDFEAAFSLTTDDVTFRPIGSHPDFGKEFVGKQDILENCWLRVFEHLSADGVSLTIKSIVAVDGIAFRESFGSGTGRSGMPYNNEYVHVYHFRGDKICSITEYLDTALFNKLLEQ